MDSLFAIIQCETRDTQVPITFLQIGSASFRAKREWLKNVAVEIYLIPIMYWHPISNSILIIVSDISTSYAFIITII